MRGDPCAISASGPNQASVPSESSASIASTLCTMLPYAIEREPHELLPAMPPSVHCADVLTSTGNHRPCGRSHAFSASSTMPGSTVTVRASLSNDTMPFKCLL